MVSDKNPLIEKFARFLAMNYSNNKTRELYIKASRKFLNDIEIKRGEEPLELTQDMLDDYAIHLNSMRKVNPFYKGFINAFRDCFDPDKSLKLSIRKDRSREAIVVDEYDFLNEDDVRTLINNCSEYMSVTLSLYFETGLRKMELLGLDLNKPEWDLDLIS